MDKMVLSKDQNVLLELFEAVRIGIISPQLAARTIGKVHHARWLNMASSLLRLYMSNSNPTKELKIMVEFVMKVSKQNFICSFDG